MKAQEFHAPKNVKKSDLYEFIEGRRNAKLKDLEDATREKLTKIKADIISALEKSGTIETLDLILKTVKELDIEELTLFKTYSNVISTIETLAWNAPTEGSATQVVQKRLEYYLKHLGELRTSDPVSDEFESAIEKWNGIIDTYRQSKYEINSVTDSLVDIVKSERRANKAYLALAYTGLNLTGLKVDNSSAPAISVTDVNAELLNG